MNNYTNNMIKSLGLNLSEDQGEELYKFHCAVNECEFWITECIRKPSNKAAREKAGAIKRAHVAMDQLMEARDY